MCTKAVAPLPLPPSSPHFSNLGKAAPSRTSLSVGKIEKVDGDALSLRCDSDTSREKVPALNSGTCRAKKPLLK